MNAIDRLIGFISEAFIRGNSERFKIVPDGSGYVQIFDNINRIKIKIDVKEITACKYHQTDGLLLHKIIIDWEILSLTQKQKIIDLLETSEDIDPEIENTINQILEGI